MTNAEPLIAQPTDPAILTPRQKAEVNALLELSDADFDAEVNAWLAHSGRYGDRVDVFHTREVAPRLKVALTRLIRDTKTKEARARAEKNRQAITDHVAHGSRLSAERKIAGQVVESARQAGRDTSPKRKAEQLLAQLHRGDYMEIERRLKDGEEGEAILQSIRERRDSGKSKNHP